MNKTFRILPVALLLFFSGCASIDFDYPRERSTYVADTSDTFLGREVEPYVAMQTEGESGFRVLSDGIDSLAVRLLLAEQAEASIDVQYYLIKDGIVGRAFIRSLLRAADRGVRVRLLLDDMFTAGHDIGIAALDSHPKFEIRIFNPFQRGTLGRLASAATSFNRINRRMHNKSFTVDNQVAVVGGRNIADEYFGAREDSAFGDLDLLAVGPVVQDVSNMFDSYWNHEAALPIPAFIDKPDDPQAELDAIREGLKTAMDEVADSRYAGAVTARVEDFINPDASLFDWAPYQLVVDSPDKGIKKRAKNSASITTPLFASIGSAKQELLIVSPYFVPRKTGVEQLVAFKQTGIDITIVTNSLAANNQFTVHGGYAPARKPLLEAGIRIFEVRPDAEVSGTEFIDASGATATLHTKAFAVDRSEVFIGSFNFDPRSAYINTELGIIVRDPDLGERMVSNAFEDLPKQAYEVFLDERDRLRWKTLEDGREVIFDKEPETTWGQRFAAGFARIIPKGQL